VATTPSPEQIAAWATGWRASDELDEPLSAEDQMIWRISYAVHCGMRDTAPPAGRVEPICTIYAEGSMRVLTEWHDGARDLPDGDYKLYTAEPAKASEPEYDRSAMAKLADIWRVLDRTLGDSDPCFPDYMSDDDIRDEYPVWWATRELRKQIDNADEIAAVAKASGSAPKMIRKLHALADKWDALAAKFAEAGSDISMVEAASMSNDAKELRELIATPPASAPGGPSAYCRACQAVGMSHCCEFDKCSGATCITCHRPFNPASAPEVTDSMALARGAWRAGITLGNNICVQESDRENDQDGDSGWINGTAECAKRIREWADPKDAQLIDLLNEAGVDTTALTAALRK
jgi:hypothetical protein